ncbi:peroxiredoxin [Caulobacter sp. 17J80-11]|uniref:peroxiredoxin n=1 Tax=Caulobacter sp. 17J80-11 TaxID=2763502 RepID=UPI001653B112|nr:peroxiredoxin [Caulobacter sp. 17J80-11]MBC6980532.1 peroxiredoxin [Caulobacter sp. 17J80-11]
MRKLILAAAISMAVAAPAWAALPDGAPAPAFTAQGALAGKTQTFSLKEALKKGPVVLYFFPAAFTKGCTLEAHEFAEATDDFKKLGATVVGITAGNIDRVAEFSSVECRDKFLVAADPGATIAASYDARSQGNPAYSNRTSYVIAPNGKIVASYTDSNPDQHVQKMLDAVKALHAKH